MVEMDEIIKALSAYPSKITPESMPESLKVTPALYSMVVRGNGQRSSPTIQNVSLGTLKSDSEMEFYSYWKFIGKMSDSKLRRLFESFAWTVICDGEPTVVRINRFLLFNWCSFALADEVYVKFVTGASDAPEGGNGFFIILRLVREGPGVVSFNFYCSNVPKTHAWLLGLKITEEFPAQVFLHDMKSLGIVRSIIGAGNPMNFVSGSMKFDDFLGNLLLNHTSSFKMPGEYRAGALKALLAFKRNRAGFRMLLQPHPERREERLWLFRHAKTDEGATRLAVILCIKTIGVDGVELSRWACTAEDLETTIAEDKESYIYMSNVISRCLLSSAKVSSLMWEKDFIPFDLSSVFRHSSSTLYSYDFPDLAFIPRSTPYMRHSRVHSASVAVGVDNLVRNSAKALEETLRRRIAESLRLLSTRQIKPEVCNHIVFSAGDVLREILQRGEKRLLLKLSFAHYTEKCLGKLIKGANGEEVFPASESWFVESFPLSEFSTGIDSSYYFMNSLSGCRFYHLGKTKTLIAVPSLAWLILRSFTTTTTLDASLMDKIEDFKSLCIVKADYRSDIFQTQDAIPGPPVPAVEDPLLSRLRSIAFCRRSTFRFWWIRGLCPSAETSS